MQDKKALNIPASLSTVKDGDVIFLGGFGSAGTPDSLIRGLMEKGLRGLTIVNNGAGEDESPICELLETGAVTKVICSFPYASGSVIFRDLYHSGKVDLELVPQGTLAERMRNAGAG